MVFVERLNRFNDLSGGQKTRELIEKALAQKPNLLLLDEPTTHLDEKNIKWLLRELRNFSGSILAVSHDRYFLKQFADLLWVFENHQVKEFTGDFVHFIEFRKSLSLNQKNVYKSAKNKSRQLQKSAQIISSKADKLAKTSIRNPFYGKKSKKLAHLAKNNQRRIENLEKVEKPYEKKSLKLRNSFNLKEGKNFIKVLNLDVIREERLLVSGLSLTISTGDKVALIGDNGVGKTTSIEAIMCAKAPVVTRSENLEIAYFHQDLSQLDDSKNLLENILNGSLESEQTARDFLGAFGIRRDKVFQKTISLSGGEKIKLALIKTLLSGANLLILDEPTNFLDITAVKALEDFLLGYSGGVLLISHDRELVETVANKIYKISGQRIIEL
ncbi:ATP-binding cassette domain-containing protein [Oenococcus oeni]|uniref:ATP-binding cassette domain-containing protein n=2 Tax=Oenococcus oeni TaxID=1247 RepID=UPI0009B52DED|nr:ATP-binding cassette domain-containing protein [Oenococcus oeni]AWW98367.1 ABC transporter ATP-binding protein [Oenococcus oeni]RJF35053.1 ABC transporter ATP-binding protein [Oenococcus oeni]